MIELIDDQFGRLSTRCDDSGQRENTIVVYGSDHGELLGDHGLHPQGLPLLRGADARAADLLVARPLAAGVRSDALVETVDIAPTLLEAAGLPVPESMQGRSLLPILTGQASRAPSRARRLREYYDAMGGHAGPHARDDGTATAAGSLVVYHDHGVGELYDLANDPGEFDNLWDDPAHHDVKAERIRYHLDAMMGTIGIGPPRFVNY